jgi:mono/diheme cytochrome c family protein
MTGLNMRTHGNLLIMAAVVAATVSGSLQAADIYKGKEVYDLYCQTCHGTDGRSMEPGTPDFSRGESLFAPDSELVRSLRDGGDFKPAFRGMLSDEELRDVIAYVRTLQR